MLIRKDYFDNGSLMGIWKMDESIDELLKLFPPSIRSEADNYINSIGSKRRVIEWLSTRIMLFELLGEIKIIQNY